MNSQHIQDLICGMHSVEEAVSCFFLVIRTYLYPMKQCLPLNVKIESSEVFVFLKYKTLPLFRFTKSRVRRHSQKTKFRKAC